MWGECVWERERPYSKSRRRMTNKSSYFCVWEFFFEVEKPIYKYLYLSITYRALVDQMSQGVPCPPNQRQHAVKTAFFESIQTE